MSKKLFAIIGNPVTHSLSPVLHNYWFNKYNIEATYSLFNISAGINLHKAFPKFPYSKFVLSVDNLTDKEYQSHVFRGTPGNQTRFFAPGRSINAQLIVRLGVAGKH